MLEFETINDGFDEGLFKCFKTNVGEKPGPNPTLLFTLN